jgi:hypothetical protein
VCSVPQLIEPPQPSGYGPQFAVAGHAAIGTHGAGVPHWLGARAPQNCPGGHVVPQLSTLPHPSPIGPQFAPALAHVRGVTLQPASVAPPSPPDGTPHWLCVLAPQISPLAHVPQSSVPPHPSPIGPQFACCAAHVSGVHIAVGVPHTLGVPLPPHVCPIGQVPQSINPPHPSAIGPQFTCSSAHDRMRKHALTPSRPASPIPSMAPSP